MDDLELELKTDFLNEALELISETESYFMKLESEPQNLELVDSIFRFAHNLKGTSRAVGFGQIAELTHVAENILLKLKQGKLTVSGAVVDVLLRFNDRVATMVKGLKENLEAQFDTADLITELTNIENGVISTASEVLTEIPETVATPVTHLSIPSADAFEEEEEIEALQVVAEVQAAPQLVKPIELPKPSPAPSPAPVENKKADSKKEEETIRVSLSRLESLSDLVGELVILQSVVERALSDKPAEVKTKRALSKLCKDIQEMAMALRMVPVGGAFQKLQRIVRDTSKLLNKKVELRLAGEETEIDRTVLEHLGDPLVHLIRNSVDHGIEEPHDRVLNGKEETGVVEVMAFHEGNNLVIQITDDGKGIDPVKLKAIAVSKGIVRPEANLSDEECINLIFAPGFSTKEQVSEVSGRGVGMDVVRTNIEALGGEIKLQSKINVGSCIRLQLPLTLAIIDGMLVTAGGQRMVLPRNHIHEIGRLHAEDVHYAAGKVPFYKLRNEVIPLYILSQDIGNGSGTDLITLIIRNGSRAFAVAIEDVLSQQQVVVKPPTKEMIGKPGVMGTTILGDGRPALILDLIDMYAKKNKDVAKKVS